VADLGSNGDSIKLGVVFCLIGLGWLGMHPLRNLFNKLSWDKREKAENYVIHYTHRGAPHDTRAIRASAVTKVGASWFTYAAGESEETLIPFHRVQRIVNTKTGRSIWTSRSKEHD
jgi:uncharacterized protein (UPF0248 family)